VVPFLALLAAPGAPPFRIPVLDLPLGIREASLLFAVIVVFSAILRIATQWAGFRFAFGLGGDLAREVFRRTLYQPYAWHVSRSSSEVLAGLTKLYERLHLKVNEVKTAVAPATGRKFLGYELWCSAGDRIKCAVARKALATFRQRIRQLTRRSGGRNLSEIAERLRAYMPGWKAYFQLAQTPKVFRELDEWIRHRLRAVQLKHWRRGTTMYRELKAMGASDTDAYRIATNSRRWWRNSRFALNRVMPIAYFDRLGVPRLS